MKSAAVKTAAQSLCIGYVSVLVATQSHSEGDIHNQEFCEFCVQCDRAAGGGKGVLLVAPTLIGAGLGDTLGDYGYGRTVVTKGSTDCDDANGRPIMC